MASLFDFNKFMSIQVEGSWNESNLQSLCNIYKALEWQRAKVKFREDLRATTSSVARHKYWDSFIGAHGENLIKAEYNVMVDLMNRGVSVYHCEERMLKAVTKLVGKELGMRGDIRLWSITNKVTSIVGNISKYAQENFEADNFNPHFQELEDDEEEEYDYSDDGDDDFFEDDFGHRTPRITRPAPAPAQPVLRQEEDFGHRTPRLTPRITRPAWLENPFNNNWTIRSSSTRPNVTFDLTEDNDDDDDDDDDDATIDATITPPQSSTASRFAPRVSRFPVPTYNQPVRPLSVQPSIVINEVDHTDSDNELIAVLDILYDEEPFNEDEEFVEPWRLVKQTHMRYVTNEQEFDCPAEYCYEIPYLAEAYYCVTTAVFAPEILSSAVWVG